MKSRFVLRVFSFTAALLAAGRMAALPVPDWRARLKEALARVSDNPEVVGMEAKISSARHRVAQAETLPDPEIEVGLKDVPVSSPSLSRDDFTMEMIAARQRFPGAGKLSADKRAVQAELTGMEAEHIRHVVEVAADVADSFFRLASLDRRIAIARETRQRLSDAVVAARERYRVGKGAQADVLRADLEKTALEDRLSALSADRRSEAARWNALQNLPASLEVTPIEIEPDIVAKIGARPVASAEDLVRQAEAESPALAVSSAEVERGRARLEAARLERRPDWELMTYYGRRQNFEDLAGISVSLTLPWVHPRRLRERQAEQEAELDSARASLSAVRNTIRRDIEQAWADLAKNRDQARLYRESILPQAEINYRAAREAYTVGTIDFLTYVRAATDLDTYEAESIERETGAARALAALQKASGFPLIEGTPVAGGVHAE